MKLVDRKTFLALPSGTVYAKYEPCYCQDIGVKHSTIGDNDWAYTSVDTISFVDSNSSNELTDGLLSMKVGDSINTEIIMDSAYRDGMFDEEQLFMVYSKEEVQSLIGLLTETLDMDAYK